MKTTKPTLHVVALPHTELTADFSWCAFTQLCRNFCTMMKQRGYKIVLYGGEHNDCLFDEAYKVHPQVRKFEATIPDWTGPLFQGMNDWTIDKMYSTLEPGDVVCLSMGASQVPIIEQFGNDHHFVEYAVGYPGVATTHRVFPSYAWQQAILTQQAIASNCVNGNVHDVVIPHFLNVDDWPRGQDTREKYLVFAARQNTDKGFKIAHDIAKALDVPLRVAGAGTPPEGEKVEYLGVLTPGALALLFGEASAVIAPTLYTEPFNLVAAEAQMCGTPVLTTDWGAFVETVEQRRTGFRARNLTEAIDEVEFMLDGAYDNLYIRDRAIGLWSFDAVAPQYDRYFRQLDEPKLEW